MAGILFYLLPLLPGPVLKLVEGGAIVNISSDGGHCGRRGALVYDASKAGVVQATKTMACELVDGGRVGLAGPRRRKPGVTQAGTWPHASPSMYSKCVRG